MFTALPAIAVLAVLGGVLAVEHRNASVDDRRVELRQLAVASSVSARRFLDDQFALLATMAAAPTLRAGRPADARRFLLDLQGMKRFTSGLSIVDADAKVRVSTLVPLGSAPIDVTDRAYIRSALDRRPAVSDVLLGKVKGRPIAAFAYPMTGGRALAGSILLDQFDTALRRLVYAPGAGETIIDGTDHVIVGEAPVRGIQPAPRGFPLERLRRTRDGVIDKVDTSAGTRIMGFAGIPGTKWVTVIDQDRGEVIGPLDRALGAELGALALLALVGVLLTLATGRRLDQLDRRRDEALAEQRAIALQLQNSLLPELRVPRGLQAFAGYVPAQGAMAVGGDWYDLVDLGDGRVAFSVGDVAGHGLAAAATMGKLRSATRAEALHGDAPVTTLSALDRFASYLDGQPLATVAYAVLDTRGGRLDYALAGHPPPLLIRASGETSLLDEGRSPLLGVQPSEPRASASVQLARGDTLVLYTDGLVERPGSPIDTELEALMARARALPGGVEELGEALLAGVREPRRDDAAVLVVRYSSEPS